MAMPKSWPLTVNSGNRATSGFNQPYCGIRALLQSTDISRLLVGPYMSLPNKTKTQEASTSENMDMVVGPSQKSPSSNTSQVTAVYPRYLVVKREEGDFTKVNPFVIQRTLYGLIGAPKNVRKIKEGLLVETTSSAQSKRLLEVTRLGDLVVEVFAHRNLNTSRGVIYCPDLLNCSTEDILDNLKDQGVLEVRRIRTKKDGELVDTPNHVLTFNTPVLPKRINVAFYSLQVRLYIPSPMRCFRCQKYGHTSLRCSAQQVCVCGKALHDGQPCTEPVTCVNCGGPHSARFRGCPVFKQESAIQEVKVKENISYTEAKRKVNVSLPTPGTSYATTLATPAKTDLTALIDQLVPKLIAALSSAPFFKVPVTPVTGTTSEADKRKRPISPEQQSLSSGDETSLSSQVAEVRSHKKKPGWPKGKPRR